MKGIVIVFSGIFLALLGLAASGRNASAATVPALPPPDPNLLPPSPGTSAEDDILEADHDIIDAETESDIRKELDADAAKLPVSFTSVIPGVSDEAWTKYVKGQKSAKLNSVTASNNLGLFSLGYRMLQDLGYVKNARKIELRGKTVWTGDFVPPLTADEFMRNAMAQYEAFAKMSTVQAAQIKSKYKDVLAGSNITLSGLMAVAKYAGMGGLDSWLTEPAKRKADTTAEFNKFNGVF